MDINFDIAASINAILWPIVLLIVLLAFRKTVPGLVEGLAKRVTKLELPGISFELAEAKSFTPEWSATPNMLDLRNSAVAMEVTDSYVQTFAKELAAEGSADYAEVSLGSGNAWLTSRLYIMAIVFAQVKGVEVFVFLKDPSVRKRYIGWAESDKIRWALARRYPYLEKAYVDAYSKMMSKQNIAIVSNTGRLEYQHSPSNAGASLELIQLFVEQVQTTVTPLPTDAEDWIKIDSAQPSDPSQPTYEHAHWMSANLIEEILEGDLHISTIPSRELKVAATTEKLRALLSVSTQFFAVISEDRRFEHLLERDLLLEQVARGVANQVAKQS